MAKDKARKKRSEKSAEKVERTTEKSKTHYPSMFNFWDKKKGKTSDKAKADSPEKTSQDTTSTTTTSTEKASEKTSPSHFKHMVSSFWENKVVKNLEKIAQKEESKDSTTDKSTEKPESLEKHGQKAGSGEKTGQATDSVSGTNKEKSPENVTPNRFAHMITSFWERKIAKTPEKSIQKLGSAEKTGQKTENSPEKAEAEKIALKVVKSDEKDEIKIMKTPEKSLVIQYKCCL
ncbi:unnamed protein product [Strongylus vulgaris]|uniref:Uncharacterized protein n=1 Tax=Strongylus vulgaris TaxID=40348 RepID=A0A3P7L3B4_STRVU|nr:unnamed protein product [Strongylus vulgaris]